MTPDIPASRGSAGACLLVGIAIALLLVVLPDAVLMPAVDRWTPRHLGLALAGLLLSAGWWLGSGAGARTAARREPLVAGGAAAAGCLVSAALLPALRELLAAGLRGGLPGLSYYPLVAIVSAAVLVPAALPLGALLAYAAGDRLRKPMTLVAAGAAAGFLAGPWMSEALLGPGPTLQVAALLAATAAILIAERGAFRVAPLRLAPGSSLPLVALGFSLVAATRLLEIERDRGALTAPVLGAAVSLGLALGCWAPRLPAAPLLAAAVAAALPSLFPAQAFALLEPERRHLPDALRFLAVGLPAGIALGALLRKGTAGPRAAAAPALLALLAPAASLVILPRFGPRAGCAALAVLAALAALRVRRTGWLPAAAVAGAALLSLAGAGPGLAPGMLPAHERVRLPDGEVAFVDDPATGRPLVALDGRAAFGRSAEQQRRFAHIPMLLHSGPRRVLVAEPGAPVTARAAWSHGPETLHWLLPFPHPARDEPLAWPGSDPPSFGTERQFLAVEREPYDLIILAPDPRAARRTALVGTVEFFELAEKRLAPGGLICQWWDLAAIDVTDLKAVIASAAEVFPQRYLVTDHPRTRRATLGLLLCREPLRVVPDRLDLVLSTRPEVSPDFERAGLDGLSVACLLIADRGMLEILAPREEALHDDRPRLAVLSALRASDGLRRLREGQASFLTRRGDPMKWIEVSPEMAGLIGPIVRDRHRSWQHLYGGAAAVAERQGPVGTPFEHDAPRRTPAAEDEALLDALAALPDWAYLRELVLGVAARLEQEGREDEAERWLRRAVDKDEGSATLRYALANLVERRGAEADALVLYRTVLAFDPQREAALSAVERLERRLGESAPRDG